MSEDEPACEAEVLLQIDNILLEEVHGAKHVPIIQGIDLLVLSLTPSEEELAIACQQLKLPPGSLKSEGVPLTFILIGEYKIPVSNTVPCIKTPSPGAPISHEYVFCVPNLFLAVKITSDTDPEILEAFDHLIRQYGVLRERPVKKDTKKAEHQSRSVPLFVARPDGEGSAIAVGDDGKERKISTRIANGITDISRFAIAGIKKGSNVIGGGIKKGSEKVVEKTDKCEKEVEISPETMGHINQARTVTKSAVMLSGGLASALIGVTAVVGGKIGQEISKKVHTDSDSKNEKIEAVKEVGLATAAAAGGILVAASDAARVLLTASCESVSAIVHHKLGGQAGQLTAESLGVVQDAFQIQQNMKTVGVKALLKRTGKEAAGQLFQDDEPGSENASSGSPQTGGEATYQ